MSALDLALISIGIEFSLRGMTQRCRHRRVVPEIKFSFYVINFFICMLDPDKCKKKFKKSRNVRLF